MSELDVIKQDVDGVRSEVAAAKTAGEQAQQVAGDKANEFAMLGLEGVSQVLQTVADSMSTVVSQLGSTHAAGDEAVSALSGVTDKTKVSETAQALDAAGEKLASIGQDLQGAAAQANDALTNAQESEVEPVANAVAATVSAIDQAKAAVDTATTKTSEYRTKTATAGQGLLNASGGGGAVASPARPRASTSPGLTATPLDAVPPKNREPIAKIGDPAEPPKLGPPESQGAYKKELDSTDDGDKGMSKARKFGRAFAKNASGAADASKDATTSASFSIDDDYDPYDYGNTHATTQSVVHAPVITSTASDMKASDVVGTSVVVAVIAVEGISRLIRKKGNAK